MPLKCVPSRSSTSFGWRRHAYGNRPVSPARQGVVECERGDPGGVRSPRGVARILRSIYACFGWQRTSWGVVLSRSRAFPWRAA